MTTRLLLPMLACLALAVPTADARVSIPPGDPPFCDIPEDPSDLSDCPVVTYSTRDCPDIEPMGTAGIFDAPVDEFRTCAPLVGPITPYIECDSGETHATCRANPTGIDGNAYRWQLTGSIGSTNDVMTGTSLTFGCIQHKGEGVVRLTITSPYSGVTSETQVQVFCEPPAMTETLSGNLPGK